MNSGPVFFTDRDLGKKFPEILGAGGLAVERHADHFQHDTPDEVWLQEIGRKGWIAVTHDGRIRYKPNELTPGRIELWHPKAGAVVRRS